MDLTDQKIFTINFSYVPAIAQPTENLEKKQNREKSGLVNRFQRASVQTICFPRQLR